MTEFTVDGLLIESQDLSSINPESKDDDRMFNHDGSSELSMVGGGSNSERGFYVWNSSAGAWSPVYENADKLDGMESGDFVHRDGSLAMQGDLDVANNALLNTDSIESGVGKLLLNSNHVSLKALSAGANVRLEDSNGLLLLDAQEGGNIDAPNGSLYEQGSRVATRTWTNANADVPNADYADDAGALNGTAESAFLHVSGDQMEGALDLGGYELRDSAGAITLGGGDVEVPNGGLTVGNTSIDSFGNISSADASDLYIRTGSSAGDKVRIYDEVNGQNILRAEDGGNVYVPNGQLSEQGNRVATRTWTESNLVNTSGDSMGGVLDVSGNDIDDGTITVWDTNLDAVPQSSLGGPASSLNAYPLQNSDLSNSSVTVNAGNQLTGGGSVGLGGSITVDVDENALDADTLDGAHKSDLDSQYVDASGDSMGGALDMGVNKIHLDNNTVSGELVSFNGSSDAGLRLENQNGYVSLTPLNDGSAHIYTDRSDFIFNKPVQTTANKFSSYNGDLVLKDGNTGNTITIGSDTTTSNDLYENGNRVATRTWSNSTFYDTAQSDSRYLRSDVADTLENTLSVSGETEVQFGGSNYSVRYDSGRDVLVIGSAENGEVMEVDNAGNLRIEGSLTEGATIGS